MQISKNNFVRIAKYLMDEGFPKTPQEISNWTGICLSDVYDILRENEVFFREIIVNDELKGWVIEYGDFGNFR